MINPIPFPVTHKGGGPIAHALTLNALQNAWNFANGCGTISIIKNANGGFDFSLLQGQGGGGILLFPHRLWWDTDSAGIVKLNMDDGVLLWWNERTATQTASKAVTFTPAAWDAEDGPQTIYAEYDYDSATDDPGDVTVTMAAVSGGDTPAQAVDTILHGLKTVTHYVYIIGQITDEGLLIQWQFGPIDERRIA